MQRLVLELLAAARVEAGRYGYLPATAMLAALGRDDPAAALAAWERYGAPRWSVNDVNIHLRLSVATAVYRAAGGPG